MRTGEETEFSIRALNTIKNSKIIFDPNAVVYHRIYQFRRSPFFIMKRCLCYGTAIAQMSSSKKQIENTLESTESSFISYLVKSSYIDRIYEVVRLRDMQKNMSNLIARSFFTFAVGIGFAVGKVGGISHSKDRSAGGRAAFSPHHSPSGDQSVGMTASLTFGGIPERSRSETRFTGGYAAFSPSYSPSGDQNIHGMAVPLNAMDISEQQEQSGNRLN